MRPTTQCDRTQSHSFGPLNPSSQERLLDSSTFSVDPSCFNHGFPGWARIEMTPECRSPGSVPIRGKSVVKTDLARQFERPIPTIPHESSHSHVSIPIESIPLVSLKSQIYVRKHLKERELEWSQLSDSNRRPTVYKTVALPLS